MTELQPVPTNDTPFNMFMGEDETEFEYGGGNFTTTAQAMYQVGFMVFDTAAQYRPNTEGRESLQKFFPYKAKSTKAIRDEAYDAANAYISENEVWGKDDKNGVKRLRNPMQGYLLTIKGDDVPSSRDGRFEWGDSTDFSPKFIREIEDLINSSLGKLTGPIPIDGYKWCKIAKVDDPTGATFMKLKKDKDGNAMYNAAGEEIREKTNSQVSIIVASYSNRDEAVTDMDIMPDASGFELSETAKANEYTVAYLKSKAAEINEDVKALVLGNKMSLLPAALDPMDENKAMAMTAEKWLIDVSDIAQLTA